MAYRDDRDAMDTTTQSSAQVAMFCDGATQRHDRAMRVQRISPNSCCIPCRNDVKVVISESSSEKVS